MLFQATSALLSAQAEQLRLLFMSYWKVESSLVSLVGWGQQDLGLLRLWVFATLDEICCSLCVCFWKPFCKVWWCIVKHANAVFSHCRGLIPKAKLIFLGECWCSFQLLCFEFGHSGKALTKTAGSGAFFLARGDRGDSVQVWGFESSFPPVSTEIFCNFLFIRLLLLFPASW